MNREIKFRVWDNKAKLFTFDYLVHQTGKVFAMYVGYTLVDPRHTDYIIQQFTGLLDKNNKEIFEGDIIRTAPHNLFGSNIHVVRYEKNRFLPDDDICDQQDIEIIGNIFENPELSNK